MDRNDKVKDLKHVFAFNEDNELVRASELCKDSKTGHTYHIVGRDSITLEKMSEPVMIVLSDKKRNHFRRYPITSPNRNKNFILNKKAWKETLVHRLAKNLLESGRVNRLILPECVHRSKSGNRKIIVENQSYFVIKEVNIEYIDKSNNRRYDALLKDINGRSLAVEFFVKHKVEQDKVTDMQSSGVEAIEINLSDLVNLDEIEIEEAIASRMSGMTIGYVEWLSNNRLGTLNRWFSQQVYFTMTKTAFKNRKDGNWYIDSYGRHEEIPNCPYYADVKDGTKRSLVETQCAVCKRCTILDATNGKMVCNQSNIDISEIIKFIYNE